MYSEISHGPAPSPMKDEVCMQGMYDVWLKMWLVDSFRRGSIASKGLIGRRNPVVPFFRFLFYLLILLSSLIHLLLTRARRVVEGKEVEGGHEDRDLKIHFWVGWCF